MKKRNRNEPTPTKPTRVLGVDEAREKAIDLLSECFARDMLAVEDFERRLDLAHAARSVAELGEAIDGLGSDGLTAPEMGGVPDKAPLRAPAAAFSEVRSTDRAVAVLGETTRAGQWVPARRTTVAAVMGSATIDLREARLGPGTTTVTAVAFMGSVAILVPPGLHVQCSGSAVLGSFERRDASPAPMNAGESVVRVDGVSVLGSVEIETRHMGETRKEARRRRRVERKRRRRLKR